MPNSEIFLNAFDEKRQDFKPYGLTCELWTPGLMKKPDRHNEIELNYFYEGTLTYRFQDRRVTIPTKRLAIFWALVPHQIVHHEGIAPYFVATIPFSQFLEWKLPSAFVDRVLKGEVVIDGTPEWAAHDEFLIKNWIADQTKSSASQVTWLEMRARLCRMSIQEQHIHEVEKSPVSSNDLDTIEQVAIYVAQHYTRKINVSDIGKAIRLHPDYANAIFKKALGSTLTAYITAERIAHAQRDLLTTEKGITEIAFDSGFCSIGRFNAAFRKINRCTPREYRKKFRTASIAFPSNGAAPEHPGMSRQQCD